jgi:hypothetical protein
MKFTKSAGVLTIVAAMTGLSLDSCDGSEEPSYPVEPVITFNNLEFKKNNIVPSLPDTIQLTIDIQDGDFDLGLDHSELDSPYHSFDFFVDNNGARTRVIPTNHLDHPYFFINTDLPGKLVTFNYQNQSGTPLQYNCEDFIYSDVLVNSESLIANPSTIGEDFSDVYFHVHDTFFVERNPSHYNIEVDFLIEQNDGSFSEFDWMHEYCTSFDGRFPYVETLGGGKTVDLGPFLIKRHSKAKATLTFSMVSLGYVPLFGGKELKLRVMIRDRALNSSNVIETSAVLIE